MELEAFREYPWNVRMPLEAVAIDQRKDAFHLPLVVDVFGKDVFVERVSGRSVDVKKAVFPVQTVAARSETPNAWPCPRDRRAELQLGGSKNGALGRGVEPFGVEHGALVMVAEQHDLALHDQIDAFARVRAIADNVAEAINLADVVRLDVGQDRLQRFQVAMDIADNRLHARPHAGDRRTGDLQAARRPRSGAAAPCPMKE